MPHMEHSLGAWFFFVCLCLDKCLKERQIGSAEHTASAELARPFTSHPHGPGSNPREAVGNANFFLWVPTRGVPLSSTQTRHHMYHIWLSAPSTPHHFQLLRPLLDKRRRRQHPTPPLFAAGSVRPPPTPASR